MPPHQRLGLEDDRGSEQRREQPVEPDEDQPICRAQPELGWRGPLQDEQLLSEKRHLGFASDSPMSDLPSRFKNSITLAQG
jgi:hypothetical protein